MSQLVEKRIRLFLGDITELPVEAIVTAANTALRGGGGVDGAVHEAAGPELTAASRALAPCPTGSARITPGFHLHARYVIHAVGPCLHDLGAGVTTEEIETLASTYKSALALAVDNNIAHIAFPCISTGAFGFPKDKACTVAINTVLEWLRQNTMPKTVTFCCFEATDAKLYQERLEKLGIIVQR